MKVQESSHPADKEDGERWSLTWRILHSVTIGNVCVFKCALFMEKHFKRLLSVEIHFSFQQIDLAAFEKDVYIFLK